MRHYGYAGQLLLSEVPLPELAREPVPDGPPRFVCRPAAVAPPAGPRRAARDADGEVTRRVSAAPGGGWIVEFAAGPVFQLHGASVTWSAPPAFPPDLLRHLLLDHALPLALSAGSDLVLHASCVNWHGVSAAFAGTTGLGKSSVAAACHARGAVAISDDCIMVGRRTAAGWTARTIYSGLRLWPDAANRYLPEGPRRPMTADSVKLRVDVPPHRQGAHPLGRLFLLRRDAVAAVPRVETARAADAMDVLRNEFRLDLDDRATLAHHFDAVVALVREDLVRLLVIPDSLDAVAAAAGLVSADLAAAAVEDCA